MVEFIALEGFPLVSSGDDLVQLITQALEHQKLEVTSGDILVITGKIVSKAEGRSVDLRSIAPSPRAVRLAELTEKDPRLVELVLRESVQVIRARPGNLLVRHRLGYVSAMAGIDRSNVNADDDIALLLPQDPDGSAASIQGALAAKFRCHLGVVITDSHGRAFRIGNVGVAIGVAGLSALLHLEGHPDLFGRPLSAASVVPVADLIASAAMLVTGEADEGIPVVLVRGLRVDPSDHSPAALIARLAEQDLFGFPDREYS